MKSLSDIAAELQERDVIPHCPSCTRPCCKLDDLVLDLDWKRAQQLYQITSSRRAFERHLPPFIKAHRGRYYVHGQACPAYVDKRCAVYGSDAKPPSCTDFPIYEDGGALTVDTRCEAVDLDAVERALAARFSRVKKSEDREFPVLVTFDVE